jgi:hypothetical protein
MFFVCVLYEKNRESPDHVLIFSFYFRVLFRVFLFFFLLFPFFIGCFLALHTKLFIEFFQQRLFMNHQLRKLHTTE